MYEQVEKSKENKSSSVANSVGQKKSNGKQGLRFEDNRPETIVQRKLQEIANKSSLSPIQLGKDKKKRFQKGIAKNPLFNAFVNSSIANKKIGQLSQKDIDNILRPTGYTASMHFAQRVSKKKSAKDDRWGSFGITTAYDFVMELKNAYAKDDPSVDKQGRNSQELLMFQGAAKIIANPDSKKIVTISF